MTSLIWSFFLQRPICLHRASIETLETQNDRTYTSRLGYQHSAPIGQSVSVVRSLRGVGLLNVNLLTLRSFIFVCTVVVVPIYYYILYR